MIVKCNKCGFKHNTEVIEGDISKIIIYDHSGKEKMIKDYEKEIITILKSGKEIGKMNLNEKEINETNIKFYIQLKKGKDGNNINIKNLNKEYSKYLKQDIRKENLIIAGDVAKIFSENHLIKYDDKNKKITIYINAVDENGNYIKEYEIFLKNEKKEKADLVFEKKGKTKIYKCKNCKKELIKIT